MSDEKASPADESVKMISDYMEKGFLENIVDMFKYDAALYDILPDLIQDERLRVRLGTTALIETLAEEDGVDMRKAASSLAPLLDHNNATIRGDVAYILGLIGDDRILPRLTPLFNDPDVNVREIARDAADDIKKRKSGAS